MMNLYAVLTLEYLRRLRFLWLLAVLLFIGGPLGVVGVVWLKGMELSRDAIGPYDFYAAYIALAALMLTLFTLLPQWQIFPHLYVRPISDRALALWLMATGVATIAGTNVLFLMAYQRLFGADWPLLTPTLFFMAFTILAQCITWNLLRPGIFKSLASLAAIAGAGAWFALRHYPNGIHGLMKPWLVPSGEELAVLLAASLAFAVIGIRGLSKARHESDRNIAPGEAYDIVDPLIGSRVPRLMEVRQTLNWFFWQRGLLYAVGASGMMALILVLVAALTWNDLFQRGRTLEMLAGMSCFYPFLVCTLVGLALGMDVRHPIQHHLMPFLSTRPISTAQLSRSLLWNAFKSALTAWSIVIIALVLFGTGFFLKISPEKLLAEFHSRGIGIEAVPLTLVGSFLVSWIGLSWMAVLGWSGRDKVLFAGTFVAVGLPILFFLFVQFVVPSWLVGLMEVVGLWLPAIVISLATFDLTVAARRGKLLSPETQRLVVLLAIGLVAFFGLLLPWPRGARILVCLYSTAALLPISVAPLMLESNRHR